MVFLPIAALIMILTPLAVRIQWPEKQGRGYLRVLLLYWAAEATVFAYIVWSQRAAG